MKGIFVSIPKIFGGFGLTLFLNVLWGILVYKLITTSSIIFFDIDLWKAEEWIIIIPIFTLGLLVLKLLIIDNRLILITKDKVIFISWIFPILFKIRRKSYYDSYILLEESDRYGNLYETIYLTKDRKIVDRISSFYYINFFDLVDSFELKKASISKLSLWKKLIISVFGITIKY
jgi:hypothetical protein